MRTLVIGQNDAGQRLDKFLQKRFKTMPKAMLYMYIRKKCIKINGKKCDIGDKLREGDVLTFFIRDEFFDAPQEKSYEFLKAPAKLDIIYEDENLLLLNKKPGVIVHQDKHYHFDSLVARVQHYLYDKGEYDPEEDRAFAPALVNRIDRNTLCGTPKQKEATLTAYMVKDESRNRVKVFGKPVEGSKEMVTHYRVLGKAGAYTLAEVELLTGRTHQIRAHMAYLGTPLAGDTKYGGKKTAALPYQALYSYKLRFSFQSDAGILAYLNGREFEVDKSKIPWLSAAVSYNDQ